MKTRMRSPLSLKLIAPVLGSLLSSAVTGAPAKALAQDRISIDAALNTWDGGTVPSELYGFRSSSEAVEAVKCVLEAVGGLRVDNFEVRAANVSNAAAAIRGNRRLLLYNPSFMQDIRGATGNPWAGIAVMAHEVGHHLEAHTITPGGSNPRDELEADEFAGNVLKRLGASLQDAQAVFRTFSSRGSSTHPPRDARLTAVANGWDRADAPASEARIRDCFRPTASAPPATRTSRPSRPRPPPRRSTINFGDDSGRYAHDESCDDNRFTGDEPWYYHWERGSFNMQDATDCRTLLAAGLIRLRATRSSTPVGRREAINFGNDSSEWANDGACDDNRFVGDSPWYYHWESGRHNMTDATDCHRLFQAGRVTLRSRRGLSLQSPTTFDFGDDTGEWAHDGACDDNRFLGPSEHYFHWSNGEYNMRDASDCRNLLDAGLIELRASR